MSVAEPMQAGATPHTPRAAESGATSDHLPALDGLRAFSVLLVMVSHAGLGDVVPGGLGVTIFFFISGFLITRLLLVERERAGRIHFGAFYMRRFLRLGPALVTYIAIACVGLAIAGLAPHLPDIAAALLYYANYYQIFGDFQHAVAITPNGEAVRLPSPFSILWSLAIEEHFYVLFPLALAALASKLTRALWVFIAALAIVLAWRLYLVGFDHAEGAMRTYMGTDTRIDSILFGCVTAIAARLYGDRLMHRHTLAIACFFLGGALLLISLLVRAEFFRETFRYTLQGIALIPIVAGLVFAPSLSIFRGLLEWKPAAYIGKLSYSLYLYHYLAAMLASWYCATRGLDLFGATWIAIFLGVAFPMAIASYHGVERPFMSLRRRFGSSARVEPEAARAAASAP